MSPERDRAMRLRDSLGLQQWIVKESAEGFGCREGGQTSDPENIVVEKPSLDDCHSTEAFCV